MILFLILCFLTFPSICFYFSAKGQSIFSTVPFFKAAFETLSLPVQPVLSALRVSSQ